MKIWQTAIPRYTMLILVNRSRAMMVPGHGKLTRNRFGGFFNSAAIMQSEYFFISTKHLLNPLLPASVSWSDSLTEFLVKQSKKGVATGLHSFVAYGKNEGNAASLLIIFWTKRTQGLQWTMNSERAAMSANWKSPRKSYVIMQKLWHSSKKSSERSVDNLCAIYCQ